MRWVMAIILLLPITAIAQEYWGESEGVWSEESCFGINFEACFGIDTNEVFFSDLGRDDAEPWDRGKRLQHVFYPPSQPAEFLFPESLTVFGRNDITPFLTYDKSRLYFSSNRPGGYGGFDIYYSDVFQGAWDPPVNMGANINSALNDIDASLHGNEQEIFFVRAASWNHYGCSFGSIFRSAYNGSQWTAAESLISPVNSQYLEASPTITSDGNKLYFISQRPYQPYSQAVWVSYRGEGIWQAPTPLEGFVNHYWQNPPPYPSVWFGQPISVSIDSMGLTLLYGKIEGTFEPCDVLYLSYLGVSSADERKEIPLSFVLSAYPNPFNAATTITVEGGGESEIAIFDITGRKITTLRTENGRAVWNANGLGSGVYFARAIGAEKVSGIIKLVYLK